MKLTNRRATILLCSVAVAAMTGAADAKPAKRAAHRSVPTAAMTTAPTAGDRDERYAMFQAQRPAAVAPTSTRRSRGRVAVQQQPQTQTAFASGGFGGSSLVSEARKYIGTNPTGRASLWCGAFMDMVLKRTGHAGGGNLAKAYASYGTRVSGPQVGAIAVMGRKGGGHVGVVSGVDANGNPIVISGNHNRTTAESVYPRSRILAYVMPN